MPLWGDLNEALRIVNGISRDQSQLGAWANPATDAKSFALGGLEGIKVLLEGGVIKLRQELGLGRGIEGSDLINQLTFAHKKVLSEHFAD